MNKEDLKKVRQLIKQGNSEAVKEVLKNDQELLFAETPFGTWLEVAASKGQIELVKYLIDSGIDVNKCCGITEGGPIERAAFEGYLSIVKLLYENGAILDVSTAEKNPLFSAIYNGNMDVVKFLVDCGIDLKASYPIGELDKVDAYEYAKQYGRTEIANYLKERM